MGGDPWDELREAADRLGVALPPGFEPAARGYLDVLARWERIGRLTGYAGEPARVRHLLIESLMLLAAVPAPGAPVLDIGSGAGAPGLVIKLARPEWEVVLVEAMRRRANFLRDVARTLGLRGLDVRQARAEALASGELAGRFQTVTLRAVVGRDLAGRLACPFLRPGGVMVCSVGPGVRVRDAGAVRELRVRTGGLRLTRRFLIIPRTQLERDVSRGTRRIAGPHPRGGQPEGRRRQDDDGPQSGRSPGAEWPPDAPG